MTERNDKQSDTEFQADDGRRWYVIHTYSGYENKVRQNLMHRIETMEMQDQIFRVIVPTEEEIEIKNGQRRTVHKKVFPGYVPVQMKMNDNSWYVVRNTPGVTSFVGHGNRPTPLDDNEVKAIIDEAYERATDILTRHMTQLTQIVGVLMEKETIDGTEIDQFFEAPKPRPRLVGPPFNEPALVAATAQRPAASPSDERREPDSPSAGGMLRPQPA